ncbi:MAG: HlyD family efflux transporter periplasmic adaptor subunit [Clostridia bacterium]|nr:HlyD family efflux transporter periplasmic adaptor subunit [Clostridia bacterium]
MEKEKRNPATDDAEELLALLGKGKKKRFSLKKLLLFGGGALALGAAAFFGIRAARQKAASTEVVYREYTVERGDVIVGQTESSSISLVRKVVQFPISATVSEIYVKAGSMVAPGDALVKFDVTEVQQGLDSYRLLLEDAALELEQAKLQQDTKLLEAGQKLEESEKKGDLATQNENLTNAQLTLNYDNAVTALKKAQDEYTDYCIKNADFSTDNARLESYKAQQEYYNDRVTEYTQLQSDLKSYQSLLTSAELKKGAILVPMEDYNAWLSAKDNEIIAARSESEVKKAAYDAAAQALAALIASGTATDEEIAAAGATSELAELEYNMALSSITELEEEKAETIANYEKRTTIQAEIDKYTSLINGLGDSANIESELAALKRNQTAAQSAYTDYNTWFKEKYGSITTAKDLITALETAQASMQKANLALEEAGLKSETDAMAAEHTAELSKQEAETAGVSYELTEMELTQKVASAQENYNTFEKQLAEVEEMVANDGVVYADHTGMIVSVNVSVGDKVSVNVNTDTHLITSYASILTINVIDDVYVPITISEEDILSVSIGQEAQVKMTAFPDKVFEAVVDSISAESARSGAATVSYTVTVKFKEKNELAMYEGMSAEVTLIDEAALDVLYVNTKAVEGNGDKASVLIKGKEENTVALITTGFTDGQNIEITSGVSEGDVLLAASGVGGTGASANAAQGGRTGAQGDMPDMGGMPAGGERTEGRGAQ